MANDLRDFPGELLAPLDGELVYFDGANGKPTAGTWSIEVPLAPFSADDEYTTDWRVGTDGPEVVQTKVSLDFIRMPGETLDHLQGRSFVFPVNPADGYIDGSIYLSAKHHPVDVTVIDFGDRHGDAIDARLQCNFIFEFELYGVRNQSAVIASRLSFRIGS